MVATKPGYDSDTSTSNYEAKFVCNTICMTKASSAKSSINTNSTFLAVPNFNKMYQTLGKKMQRLAELVDLFIPNRGTVLDPCAGAMIITLLVFGKF